MDLRRYHQVRAPLSSPIGYALVFPVVEHPRSDRVIGHIAQLLFDVSTLAEGFVHTAGTIEQTLFGVAQLADGHVHAAGDIDQTLLPLSQHVFGKLPLEGTVAQILRAASQHADAATANPVPGQIKQVLPRLLQALLAETNHADIKMLLDGIEQQAIVGVQASGPIAQVLALIRQTAGGAVPTKGDIAQLLALIRQHAAAIVPDNGTIEQYLFRVSQHVTAKSVNVDGDVAQTLFRIAQAINASNAITARASMTVGIPLVFQLLADVSPAGSVLQRLARLEQAGDAMVHPTGAIAQRFYTIISTMVGARSAAIVQELFPIRQSFVSGMESFGAIHTTFRQPVYVQSQGTVSARGVINQHLFKFDQHGLGIVAQTYGAMAQMLSRPRIDLIARTDYGLSGAQVLPRLFMGASAVLSFHGQTHQTLFPIAQEAQTAINATWGSVAQMLGRISQAAVGLGQPQGVIAQRLGAARVAGEGWIEVEGPISQRLNRVLQDARGGNRVYGATQISLPQIFMQGQINALNYGHVAQALAGPSQDASGWGSIIGAAAPALFRIQMAGGGLAPNVGTVSQKLGQFTQAAQGKAMPSFRATVAQSLFGVSQTVRGFRKIEGQGAQTLFGVSSAGYGTVTTAAIVDEEKMIPNGRLTLTTGTPWLGASVSGQTTVYYTPAIGSTMYYWTGTMWASDTFSELSQALSDTTYSPSAAVASASYDMFVWKDGGGTYRLSRGPAWLNTNDRGTGAGTSELQMKGGFFVNRYAVTNGPPAGTGLYVGSIHTNYQTQLNYSVASDFTSGSQSTSVFNAFNQREAVQNAYDRANIFSGDDPYWANVAALLIVSGTNIVYDASSANRAVSNNGGTFSTSVKKFTGSSIDLRAGGSNLQLAYDTKWAALFATGFTWEFWYYPTSWTGTDNILIDTRSGNSTPLTIFINAAGQLCWYAGSVQGAAGTAVSLNAWHHIALSASGGTWRMFLDGAVVSTGGGLSDGAANAGTPLRIAVRNDGTLGARGYYDQIRITYGVNRYPAAFTPPISAFPTG